MTRILLLSFVFLQTFISYAQTPLRIVCMGNSITHGAINQGTKVITEKTYRPWLWEKLDSAGVDVDMVGYTNFFFGEQAVGLAPDPIISRYTGKIFDRDHDAYYGIKSDGLLNGDASRGWTNLPLPKLSDRLKNYTPDIALLHIGTNDNDEDVDQTEANIKTIIEELRTKNPRVMVFVAKLTFWKPINLRVDRIAEETWTEMSPVIAVDQNTGYDGEKYLFHPNDLGGQFMAQRWYDAIIENMPTITSTKQSLDIATSVQVYPTISKGRLTIDNANNSQISIYNINGSLMTALNTNEAVHQNIDLPELENGMYFLKVTKEGKASTKTFIIEK